VTPLILPVAICGTGAAEPQIENSGETLQVMAHVEWLSLVLSRQIFLRFPVIVNLKRVESQYEFSICLLRSLALSCPLRSLSRS
jgi:hypothetical protein